MPQGLTSVALDTTRVEFWESQLDRIDTALRGAEDTLVSLQHSDGYWVFELEADCTIPAEYVLMMHFMDEVDEALQQKIAVYLRANQTAHGGWPLYHGGTFNLSCSVKAYYALKLAGDSPDAPHMVGARGAILAHGGAARTNVFTRIALALFEQVPWRAVPFIPVEIVLLPRWFPFHLSKVSYWSRTVMVPLFILCAFKPKPKRSQQVHIRELFTVPPEEEKHYFPIRSRLNHAFLTLDRIGRWLEPLIPRKPHQRAIRKAEQWVIERLNGLGGLGAIFPAMVNAYEALDCLGYPADHPYRVTAKQALERLLVIGETSAYCQPCMSPIWDTALACLALQESKRASTKKPLARALTWLQERQLDSVYGDWSDDRPGLRGGGWPFQFYNAHYPDLDDTAVVAWAMQQADPEFFHQSVRLAADWIQGMQSHNDGFAAFDADNTYYYLNEIPFADHGALLDPPSADVSARCLTLFALLVDDHPEYKATLEATIAYLKREQEPHGSWFGRWGSNYIYGTWSVLVAFEAAGVPCDDSSMCKAVNWLQSIQREDGGWGETNDSYEDPALAGHHHKSTSFQTAWAMLALIAAGEGQSEAVQRGAEYLLRTQQADGLWWDEDFTAPGFPRVFYLRYHGYTKLFPLWALARYRNVTLADKA